VETDFGPPWFLGGVADALAAALVALDAALRLEDAPHGVDEWDERRLQLALADALRGRVVVGVEVPYPSTIDAPRRRQRRCDLVISPDAPEEALWLELKVARQWRAGGAREPRYADQWRRHLIADLRKLAVEPQIRAAAIVLIVFTDDEDVLARDLDRFESVMIRAGVVAGFRQVRTVPVQDRIGHRFGAIAAWPTIQE
jgi:hypothetical protein